MSSGASANMPTISSIDVVAEVGAVGAGHRKAFGEIALAQARPRRRGGTCPTCAAGQHHREPATALTSSLCHAAVMKSGSSLAPGRTVSAQQLGKRRARASCGQHQSDARAQRRTHPSGCVSAENHTGGGHHASTTGRSGRPRSICSTPFCSAHTTVRSSHSRASQGADPARSGCP